EPGDARVHQLADERGRQRLIRLEANRPLAGLEVLQLALKLRNDAARVESAVLRAGAEPHEHPAIEAERGELIADALLRARHDRPDGPPQPLERCALAVADARQVVIDGRHLRLGHVGSLRTY